MEARGRFGGTVWWYDGAVLANWSYPSKVQVSLKRILNGFQHQHVIIISEKYTFKSNHCIAGTVR